jgi:NAD(P)-dependent dehydrogenase (short-subunit alcohol dehydrogenase family)
MSRVAVVTGASRGIGAATAQLLARQGFRVVVNYRSSAAEAEQVVTAARAAGGQVIAVRADVTQPDDVDRMVDETQQKWGRGVDILVHNALIPYQVTSFADLSWEQLGGKVEQELHAAFLLTKAVVPEMKSIGFGRLIFMTTILSRRPRGGMISLGTAKAAMDQFVRYVALELAPDGITANLVSPATVANTEANQLLAVDDLHHLEATNPMGRLVRPEEVAHTIGFLASEDSGFITGHCVEVNGGLAMD